MYYKINSVINELMKLKITIVFIHYSTIQMIIEKMK